MPQRLRRPFRRHRRDRLARNVALLLGCAGGLLLVAGVVWLVQPVRGELPYGRSVSLYVLDEAIHSLAPAGHDAPAPPVRQQPEVPRIIITEAAENQPERLQPQATGPTYNGRPIGPVRTIRMLVTAYSPDERSCGKFADNITASGYSVWTNGMKLAAADKRLMPFGTILTVPGYNGGRPIPVLDRGGKIKGHRLDVLYPTHTIAKQWGARWLDVVVWDYAD